MRSFGEISATLWSCVEIVIVDTRDTETRRAFQTSPSLALFFPASWIFHKLSNWTGREILKNSKFEQGIDESKAALIGRVPH